ncbi:hypothetical protein Bca4012_017924 [Brassica carinata]
MLLIIKRSHVPLTILSIEDVTVLKSSNHLHHPNKKVDFIERTGMFLSGTIFYGIQTVTKQNLHNKRSGSDHLTL